MAQPVSILGDVHGMARDFALDQLPKGYVWDLVDYVPHRRGARLDGRRAWKFLTPSSLSGTVWGGRHAPFRAGKSLLVATNSNIYAIDPVTGAATNIGSGFTTGKQNGVMLRDRVYFADGAAAAPPKAVTRSGSTHSLTVTGGPNASLLAVFKDRLLSAGDPTQPQRLYFSPLETDGGPIAAYDALSQWDMSLAITGIWPMGAQILLFHDGSIEKLRGTVPPATDVDTDMYLDPFSDQMGCSDPASIVGWQENVVWADARGVYLSDGSTIRSLTQQGGIAELWRALYNSKRTGTQVVSSVFLDLLFVSVLTDWDSGTPHDLRPFTLICDLSSRSWIRFANMGMTAAIPSNTDGEEVWWGPDSVGFSSSYQYKLARLSDTLFTESEVVVPVASDQVDGNGVPVLPQIETGFIKLGKEGVKRFRHIYVSHTTETGVATAGATTKLRVSFRLRPYPYAAYEVAGDIPGIDNYRRYRLRIDRRGYGITVKVEQTIPTWLSRLHDIAVDTWGQDRGKL